MRLKVKFTSKELYESTRIWLQVESGSIHMSQFDDKKKSHKEANIADMKEVVNGGPKRPKPGDPLYPSDINKCATVRFVKGGGIDIIFDSQKDRDDFSYALRQIKSRLPM